MHTWRLNRVAIVSVVIMILVLLVLLVLWRSQRGVIETATLLLPVVVLPPDVPAPSDLGDKAIIRSGIDGVEPPEVPPSFDVYGGTTIVIADQDSRKLLVYPHDGKGTAIRLGFAPERVRFIDSNTVQVSSVDGQLYSVSLSGAVQLMASARIAFSEQDDISAVKIIDETHFLLTKTGRTFEHRPLHPSLGLLYVGFFGEDDAHFYFDIEAGTLANPSSITKRVCKYDRDGIIQSCVGPIDTEYYGFPRDELRVSSGILFQMYPTAVDLQVKSWKWIN